MIKLNKVLYTAVATAEGGRDGHTASDDGRLDVKLSPPAELGGAADGIGTTHRSTCRPSNGPTCSLLPDAREARLTTCR